MLTSNSESQDKNPLESTSPIINNQNNSLQEQITAKNNSHNSNIWQAINPFQKNKKIRTQLLSTILPTVLTPLAIVSGIGYWTVHQRLKLEIEDRVKNHVLLTHHATDDIFRNSLEISSVLVKNPLIISAARKASAEVGKQKVNQLSIEKAEAQFSQTKLLKVDPILNNYLANLIKEYGLAEVFFTDANGYNLAYSNPTSDFVQRDEKWWQEAKAKGSWFSGAVFDESAGVNSIEYAQVITDPDTGYFLGVSKFLIPFSRFKSLATYLQDTQLGKSENIQVIDIDSRIVMENFTQEGFIPTDKITGGETIINISQDLVSKQQQIDPDSNVATSENNQGEVEAIITEIENKHNLSNFQLSIVNHANHSNKNRFDGFNASFLSEGKRYYLTTIPQTKWVAIASIDEKEMQEAGRELIWVFLAIAVILGCAVTGIILYISHQLSKPLTQLANTAEEVAEGNLDAVAQIEGSLETATLGNNFNNLVTQVKSLLEQQEKSIQEVQIARLEAEKLAQEQQKQAKETQQDLLFLVSDVEGASNGDLTVRAQISEGEIGIVADFFNSIVESLRDIVTQVKETTIRVNESLINDEEEMAKLATKAANQSKKIKKMLDFVEQMTQSIQQVAQNTQSALLVAQKASTTAQTGGVTIDKTVESIVHLRDTVGDTAKKVKRLGESSQEISKVISLINQIALQTNLLAINASIEAARAGEEGRGFAVVAEEIGQLAAQSATATKEIEQIVEAIQKETSNVVEAMEDGTAQVVESTKLVAEAKQGFGEITQVSQEINDLLRSITGATVSQTQTSQMVTNLMKEIAKVSQISSDSSIQVANSLEKTLNQARQLQSSVETFKVN